MNSVLHVDVSPRVDRSLSRRMSQRFIAALRRGNPSLDIVSRDIGQAPPPHVDLAWIAAVATPEDRRDPAMRAALAVSDALVAEVIAADLIVIGTPMYNYGMPSALKAWVDQIVRSDRTYSFDLQRGDWPIEPRLSGKRLVLLIASGEFGFDGGVRADWDHLRPHVRTIAHFLGVARDAIDIVEIEYQEFKDDRHAQSIAAADLAIDALAVRLASQI